ncbi:MAG: hypothetical protein MI749_15555 [Desulfovibrionales bacterium]|nr:hypothetical protein [Desulfovibrionales bacterium]
MVRMPKIVIWLVCCSIIAVAGCTHSQVRLRYLPEANMDSVTMQHNISIGLVQFKDARPEPALGNSNGKQLMPVSNVAAWITHGLEAQLMRHGIAVEYVLNTKQVTKNNWITGKVEQLTVTRLMPGKFKGELTVKIAVNGGLATTYKASLVKQGVPYTNIVEPLLAELVNDMLQAAVPEILSAV